MHSDKTGRHTSNGKTVIVDREKYNAYMREYRQLNLKKIRTYRKNKNKQYRKQSSYAYDRSYNRTWKDNHPIKRKAHTLIERQIRSGKLQRRACEATSITCSNAKTIAHHNNYRKPLEVIFLCRSHHARLHNALPMSKLNKLDPTKTLQILAAL
jgi:hypothetical protein